MISFSQGGSTAKTKAFLAKMQSGQPFSSLERLAQRGVAALQEATPKDSGQTAYSWSYKIEKSEGKTKISWVNSNITSDGTPVVILLQYGHGTGTGGYVSGRDFINPAIKSVFDEIADEVWRQVKSA